MKTKQKFIIEDSSGNHCFTDHTFDSYEDGWAFLYETYPVIHNDDGTQDDRDDELGEYYVIKTN
jgi:hypothetical protein